MGKNKKSKSIGRLLIDLTPLLDVVFIVLIVVLAGQDSFSAEAEKKFSDAEQIVSESEIELSEMEAKVNTYSEQMAAYESINEFFNIVTVYSAYTPGNRRIRTIYVMINNEQPKEINLTPSNTSDAWDECRKLIEETIKKDESLPTILTISTKEDTMMLYRDEQSIKNMFFDIKDSYQNISIK